MSRPTFPPEAAIHRRGATDDAFTLYVPDEDREMWQAFRALATRDGFTTGALLLKLARKHIRKAGGR